MRSASPPTRSWSRSGASRSTDRLGLEELVLDMDGRFIRIGERCETSMRGIYAIGDVTGEPMLAHRAMAQGEMVAEIAAGLPRAWDKRCIPASASPIPRSSRWACRRKRPSAPGSSQDRAIPLRRQWPGHDPRRRAGLHPHRRAGATQTVLGIQAVGQGVSELSTAFGLAIEMGATLEDIAGTIHAHPTLGEGFQEAALKALGQSPICGSTPRERGAPVQVPQEPCQAPPALNACWRSSWPNHRAERCCE
jgi:dihydrolipoamide dehydrogenase